MISIASRLENFDKYKIFILETIINYYGEEYRDKILKRFKTIYFNFSSTPEEEYHYMKKNLQAYSFSEMNQVVKNYEEFCKIKEKYKSRYNSLLIQHMIEDLGFKEIQINEKVQDLLFEEIINKEITLKNMKNTIKRAGLKVEKEKWNPFLEYCKSLQEHYRNRIVEEMDWTIQIKKDIKKQFNLNISSSILRMIAFKTKPFAGSLYVGINRENLLANYIRIPLCYLLNHGIKSLDVCLIHEIIHKIETYKDFVGISIENKMYDEQILTTCLNATKNMESYAIDLDRKK